jgi:hypothetical protein
MIFLQNSVPQLSLLDIIDFEILYNECAGSYGLRRQ